MACDALLRLPQRDSAAPFGSAERVAVEIRPKQQRVTSGGGLQPAGGRRY
jgi:hypothetical protein